MFTVIAYSDAGETQIRRYAVDSFREAWELFMESWIAGEFTWEHFEYYGPNCTVENPAFTPEFLRRHDFGSDGDPIVEEGVIIYTWWCITGRHGSDEHFVTGYFVEPASPPRLQGGRYHYQNIVRLLDEDLEGMTRENRLAVHGYVTAYLGLGCITLQQAVEIERRLDLSPEEIEKLVI